MIATNTPAIRFLWRALFISFFISACTQETSRPTLEASNTDFLLLTDVGDVLPEQPDDIDIEVIAQVGEFTVVHDRQQNRELILNGEQLIPIDDLEVSHPARLAVSTFRQSKAEPDDTAAFRINSSFSRTSDQTGDITIFAEDTVLSTRSVSNGHLASARLLKKTHGEYWVQQEELNTEEIEYKGETVFRFQVVAALRHFNNRGEVIGETSVVLKRPRGTSRLFQINASGDVYFLNYNSTSRRMEAVQLVMSGSNMLVAPGELTTSPIPDRSDDMSSFEKLIRSQTDAQSLMLPVTSRAQIMQRAETILNTKWPLQAGNYSKRKANLCNAPEHIWLRPKKLTAKNVGEEISGPPYKWGGNQPLSRFLEAINNGAVAGDICTCRCKKGAACTAKDWCIDSSTAGFDCSGFVANAWGIPYHSTSTLHKVATPIRWQDLQPGDILNSPGKHVRLFEGFAKDDSLGFIAIESSVGCSGLCRKTFSIYQLVGYIAYRHDALRQSD